MNAFASNTVEARWLVASLGEASKPAWWRSQATTDAGIRFLERLYPRTTLIASLETASKAASVAHDASLARSGHQHLIRLPAATEISIREWLLSPAGTELLRRLVALSPEDRLEALTVMAGSEEIPQAKGPLSIGAVAELTRPRTMRRVSAGYVAGF